MPDLGELSIGITASSGQAVTAIGRLTSKLESLQTGLSRISASGFTTQMNIAAQGAASLSNAVAGLNGVRWKTIASGMTSIASASKALSGADFTSIRQLSSSLSGLGSINVNGLASLATSLRQMGSKNAVNAASAIPQIAQGLSSLSGVQLPNMEGFAQLAQALRALGSKGIQNAAAALPTIADGLRQIASIHIPDLSGLTNLAQVMRILGRSGNGGGAGGGGSGNAFWHLSASFEGMKRHLDAIPRAVKHGITSFKNFASASQNVEKRTRSLASAIGTLYAKFFLLFRAFRGIKSAIDAASDLVEVQNVVDQTFRGEKQKMEDFAKTSIVDFGMSELTAKKIGSRFQAMGTAMGITNEQVQRANEFLGTKGLTGAYADLGTSMADVSLTLTKLSADMSSFYNVENYEEMAQDLTAILTGMTRPLRDYGLDLTNATLQEWAMKNGIDADVKSMSQAEKTMLRYQYLLSQTTSAQNDFSRTAGTWANQIRLMGELFNKLKVAIGRGFIGMLKPLVRAVNRALNTIIDIVEQVVNALGIIFGWEVDIGNVGLAEEWEDTAGYADDAAGAMGDAADSAKKLKDYTLGIDELNIFHPDDDSDSGGGGGGGAGGGGGGASQVPVSWENDGDGLTSRFLDLIQKIVRPFQEAWKNAGQYVTDAWRYMLDEIGKLVHDIGRDMLEVWNQDRTIEMLTQVYRIVGDIFVTIGNIAMRLREAWNYNQTGLHILENIRDAFAIIIDHVRNVTSKMRLWAYNLDFKPLLTSFEELTRALVQVADFVGGVFEDLMLHLVLPYIKHLIEVSIPNLNRALTSIVENVDWDRLRENIDLIIKAAEGLLESITDGLVQTVENLGIAIGNFVNSEEFQTFCENLANFMERIDAEMVSTVLTGIGLAILDIAEALVKFINSEPFQNFLDAVLTYLENATAEDIAKKIKGLAIAIAAFKFTAFVGTGVLRFLDLLTKLHDVFKLGSMSAVVTGLATTATVINDIATAFDKLNENKIAQKLLGGGDREAIEAYNPWGEDKGYEKYAEFLPPGLLDALNTLHDWLDKVGEKLDKVGTNTSSTDDAIKALNPNLESATGLWEGFSDALSKTDLSTVLSGISAAISLVKGDAASFITWWVSDEGLGGWLISKVFPDFSLETWLNNTVGMGEGLKTNAGSFFSWWNGEEGYTNWWNAIVLPGFSLDTWSQNTTGMNLGLQAVATLFFNWWSADGYGAWWTDVLTAFEENTWFTNTEGMSLGLTAVAAQFFSWWLTEDGYQGWWDKDVVPKFAEDQWNFPSIKTGLMAGINAALDAARDVIGAFFEWASGLLEGLFGAISSAAEEIAAKTEVVTYTSTSDNTHSGGGREFASGGFPTVGSMFIAGEAGAEFVGNIGGRTGVVNTDQMAESVAAGNAQVVNVLLQVVDAIMSKDVSVNIGDREIALAANRGQSAIGRTIITG